eukprot:UN19568
MNNKLTYPAAEAIQEKCRKQIEFYLSDANLPNDKFLQNLVNAEDNPEDWVPLDTILTFGLIKQFTEDVT